MPAMVPELLVVRAAPAAPAYAPVPARATDVETTDGDVLGVMEVRFSVFGIWYEINSWWEGHFLERTRAGAFAKTMRESGASARVLFNHGGDFHIGDKILGLPENLREESAYAVGDVPLLDTSYNRDLLPGLKRGGYGSSYMFRVIKDEWDEEPGRSDHNPDGIPERTVTEVRLYEFGPVTWPANPAATAGMRSATDAYYERLRRTDPTRVERLAARVEATRTASAPAAPDTTVEPDTSTQHGITAKQRREALYPALRG